MKTTLIRFSYGSCFWFGVWWGFFFNTNNILTIDCFKVFYHEKYKKVWLCWKCQGLWEENMQNRCLLFKVTM